MARADVEPIVREVAGKYQFSDPDLLLATVNAETGFDPLLPGDNGHSWGPFQENDAGRGAGLSVAQRQDVAASTARAIREFNAVQRPGLTRGQWAAAAQRPANRVAYAQGIDNWLSGQNATGSASPGLTNRSTAPSEGGSGQEPAWYRELMGASGQGAPAAPRTPAAEAGGSGGEAPEWYRELMSSGNVGAASRGSGGVAPDRGRATGTVETDEVWPVVGQPWGKVNNPFGGPQARSAGATVALPSSNVGADLTAAYGAPVVAPVSGVVVSTFDAPNETDRNLNGGWGGSTLLKGDNGFYYRLSHAKPGSILAQPGERVDRGQLLQRVGVSGNTTGPHVDAEKFDTSGHFVDIAAGPGHPSTPSPSEGARVSGGSGGVAPEGVAPEWYRELMGGRAG